MQCQVDVRMGAITTLDWVEREFVMPFDIDKIGQGERFPFMDSKVSENGEVEWLPVDTTSDEYVCFKQINPDEFREIREKYKGKKTNVPVPNPTTRAMEVVVQYEQTPEQERKERMEYWDKSIVEWNIKTPNGAEIPCTADNKYKLVTGDQRFLRFANKCLQLIAGAKDEEKEAEKKTS